MDVRPALRMCIQTAGITGGTIKIRIGRHPEESPPWEAPSLKDQATEVWSCHYSNNPAQDRNCKELALLSEKGRRDIDPPWAVSMEDSLV